MTECGTPPAPEPGYSCPEATYTLPDAGNPSPAIESGVPIEGDFFKKAIKVMKGG